MTDDLPGRARLLDNDVRAGIAIASEDRRRRIAIAVARAALDRQPRPPRQLSEALSELAMGHVDPATVAQVREIAERLDEVYLTLHDDEKAGDLSEGWESAFRLARAASAVVASFDGDATVAAIEASYEAWHALDCDPGLRSVVRGTP